ncbi:MAG: SDR family oxidoreductase [Coriobacteriia bacterium]|nr:SDR family oxidoreductase [Coriobacteriia bacterium]
MPTATDEHRLILVTGATGYIGGSLLRPLVDAGYRVRAAARTPERLAGHVPEEVDVVGCDVLDSGQVTAALEGVDTAFYLVHSLGDSDRYAELDRNAALIFSAACREQGVRRIVYLGGLGANSGGRLSEHLASRQEVGRELAAAGVPVVEFRASIVLGAGSTSFEMIRNLVEKLPAMTTPRWVRMASQPIALADVVAYLVASVAVELEEGTSHRIYEIGGSDRVSYGDLMRLYAHARGLRRLVLPVPVLSPGLSGWWLYLFTPKQAKVGRQLAESPRFPTVVTDDSAARDFPGIHPIGAAEAMEQTLRIEDEEFARICWDEEYAGRTAPVSEERQGRYIDSRVLRVACPPEAAFDPIACIGGERGWYAFDTLWDLRGFIDILLGGPGRRRGRKDPFVLVEGDYLDWWRVERLDPPRLLRLVAEMRLPGRGWLQYELRRDGESTIVRQTALFDAKGVLGRLYWYSVLPFHHFVFNGTLQGVERECLALVSGPNTCPLPGAYDRSLERRASESE